MKTIQPQKECQQQDIIEQNITDLLKKIEAVGDKLTAYKIKELLRKWQGKECNIGFCGHFSAGKSTMINQLLGKSLLPASPIPTSANLVFLRYGQPHAEITFTDGTQINVDVSRIEQWKEYCKNGQEVEKVEIYDDHPFLKGGIQLLDTPGIDSTDESHQASTEAALHLADVIIFVTDYNHVQSEVNFSFIKSLKEKGKTLFLIINQIDKHREKELSLRLFQEKVQEGLSEWGIKVDGLLFASMKEPEHPYNQFKQIEQLLGQVKHEKETLIEQHFFHALQVLIDEHGQFLHQQQRDKRTKLNDQLEEIKKVSAWEENPDLLEEYAQSLEASLLWKKELETETGKILTNAIITPYVTTQLAQALIESYQKDFKMGWLFIGQKTELERSKRLGAFYKDLAERVTSQIEWHLKELLRKKVAQYSIDDRAFHTQLMDWELVIPKEWLTSLIQPGFVSREYVYNYTKDLAKKIHQLYRGQMELFIKLGQEKLTEQHEKRYLPLQKVLQQHTQMKEKEIELEQMKRGVLVQVQAYLGNVNKLQIEEGKTIEWKCGDGIHSVEQDLQELHEESQDLDENSNQNVKKVLKEERELLWNTSELEQTAVHLEKAAQLLQQIPSLIVLANELNEKASRLKNNRFTICLFGAFSAGKSSFANALLGENVLPVSPNPTTAAINQVLPATDEHPSGTAMIQSKSRAQVEEEILLSLKRLQLPTKGSVKENLKQIEKIQPHELRTTLKPYYSFLQACYKGWDEAEVFLDSHFKVDENTFQDFVAVEQKACFVESIQLYHDSYLTRNGLEIIDTPGADSIYSRHTNVTFNYIKNADVILYVTYYNHAFSRADRQFLDQLGRVKDQFALDKMFFMVNAADLAESEEELAEVVEHVDQNLLQSGIRFPRIHPVSSLKALEEGTDSGMRDFEKAFFNFIQEDLTELLIGSAHKDLERGYALLVDMKEEIGSSAEGKQAKMMELKKRKKQWVDSIQEEGYPAYLIEIEKEIKELFYYVKQRLFFEFQQHVNEAFHPSILTREQSGKKQLSACLDEVLFSILYQLKEELKASSLRLEKFTYRLLDRAIVDWNIRVEDEHLSLTGSFIARPSFDIPHLPEQLEVKDRKKLEETLSLFKSPKQFFEQGGKERLRQDMEEKVEPLVVDYMREAESIFLEYYQGAWEKLQGEMKKGLATEFELAVSSRLSALSGDISVRQLEEMMTQYKAQ
jgi:small GTP-binding protein